ncbi:helix-turn-helix domain-containing protein [Halocynthiibacter sp. C4]|uniref:helix-turn-helix domain-containing protein n=1 Tax=Halocynthiibacter sp. C4 TaxID=2992758 RepID=UPI00237A398C|nr:helix-turn-helix domain-containing protein [Halocynthiibacter sp. C4]MDE0591586.1 helix-turn-helix domain-containing protein [Halocynthiibacter sp. C4]
MQTQVLAETQSKPTSTFWDGFITETDAADYLCQSIRTLQKWRVTGFGPQFYKPGRSVRYRRRDLRDWAESRMRRNTSQI